MAPPLLRAGGIALVLRLLSLSFQGAAPEPVQAPPRPLAGMVVLGGGSGTAALSELLAGAAVRRPGRAVFAVRAAREGAVFVVPVDGILGDPLAPAPDAVAPGDLGAAIAAAGGVWLAGPSAEATATEADTAQVEWSDLLQPTAPLAVALRGLVESGGVVGTEGGPARLLGVDGAALVPDLLVASLDEDCTARSAAHPNAPLLRIGAQAAAVVVDRLVVAAKPGSAAPDPAGGDRAEARRAAAHVSVSLPGTRAGHGEAPLGTLKIVDGLPRFDRLALVRAARERDRPVAATASVAGTLLLAGGGALPEGYVARFLELAGGPEARLVVLGARAARPDEDEPDRPLVRALHAACASLRTVRADPARPGLSADELSALRDATGVWIEGGRACDLVDAYLESQVPRLLAEVLARGGVCSGASAGASIQADVLARGGPFDNRDVLVAGYSRGFALLAGCAVDQHLSARGRFPDLLALKRARPELLVIGIDEATALEVRGAVGTVSGRGSVWFLGGAEAPETPEGAATRTAGGERYDLVRRRPLP